MDQSKSKLFEKMLDESFKKRKRLEKGAIFESKVHQIRDEYIFIKTFQENIQGIIDIEDFGEENPKVGDKLNVYFLQESHGDFYFTIALSGKNLNEDNLEIAREKEIPVWGYLGKEINGGYEIKLGEFLAFCPFSHINTKTISGTKLKFIINEINLKNNKIVVSHKKISEKEKELKKEILKDELEEGNFVSCTVKSIHNFGLIVDMNGFDALIPVSESSFKRKVDLEKEYQIGQSLRAKIIQLNWNENKITLTMKDSLNDPWSEKIPFKEGDIVTSTIDSIKPFGLMVRFDDHFHALVPNKETGLPIRTPLASHFKVGEKIEVFITEINPVKRQISASLAKSKEAKEKLEYQSYLADQSVSNKSSFGLLLQKSLKKK
ncbi:MAG: S1 RNA-binding domain-containing protein [Leptospiraceae bacterium]|nr:S1 RNA-binding domain-containing protein [Leptospiraceae bacterium]